MRDDAPRHLLVFGAGGFGREVAWLARSALPDTDITFVVDAVEYATGPVDGIEVALLDDVTPAPGHRYVVALGNPQDRARAVASCEFRSLKPLTIVDPDVNLSGHNVIGEGSVLCRGSVITTGTTLGRHVQLHVNSCLGHDVTVGDFTTISPGANIAGHVAIGEYVYVGIGATIINGSDEHPLEIGKGAVVAAGACVTRSVDAGTMVAGVPALRKG